MKKKRYSLLAITSALVIISLLSSAAVSTRGSATENPKTPHEVTSPDPAGKKLVGKSEAKEMPKTKNVNVNEPHTPVSNSGETTQDVVAEVVTDSSGEAGTLESVPGFTPREALEGVDETTTQEKIQAKRRELLAKHKELMSLPAIEDIEFVGARDVCGSDGRVRITNTTAIPWRWNCQLIITLADGRQARGTGWFSGPCVVMTAGHCVYSHAAGGWARSIEIIPGLDGTNRPYGSQTVSGRQLRSVTGWTTGANPDYDYGAMIMPNSTLGNRVGWYGFAVLTDSELNGLLVNTAGYPGDKPFGTMWFMADQISRVTPRKIFYMIDTYGGQSGSALYRLRNGQRQAVGIHAYGGCANSATRITRDVFDNMIRWRNECRP